MYLQSLHVSGFKTFSAPTTVDFAPGITAIVGPNGSGKSNLIDAVRWVLGEQSMKDLRVRRAEDVIFAGTTQRRPAAMAEACVNFDNQEGWLAIEGSEVELTRRVYRSGEGEYLINRDRVRLRDIQDALSDSGLIGSGQAIIGQGLVDSVLSARGADRRALIAAASGVAPYESRRAEALRRLELSRQNTANAALVLGELVPRLKLLRRQASLMENAARAQEELRAGLTQYYGARRERLVGLLAETRRQSGEAKTTAAALRARAHELESEVQDRREAYAVLRQAHEDARGAVLSASVALERARHDEAAAMHAIEAHDRELAEVESRVHDLHAQGSATGAALLKQQSRLSALVTRSRSEAEKTSGQERSCAAERTAMQRLERAYADACAAAERADQAVTTGREQCERLQAKLSRLGRALWEAHDDRERMLSENQHLDVTLGRCRQRQLEAQQALAVARNALDERIADVARESTDLSTARAELANLREEQQSLQRRHRTLQADQGASCWPAEAALVDTLRFDTDLAAAVASALGDLSGTPASVQPGIPGLRPARMPVADWRERITAALAAQNIAMRGWMDDIIRLRPECEPLQPYLATVLVLDHAGDLDRAWDLVASLDALTIGHPALRFVSRDGHQRGGGFYSQASSGAREVVDRTLELGELTDRMHVIALAVQQGDEAISRRTATVEDAVQERQRAEEEYRRAYIAAGDTAREREGVERSRSRVHASIKHISAEIERLQHDEAKIRAELSDAESRRSRTQGDQAGLADKVAAIAAERQEARNRIEGLEGQVRTARHALSVAHRHVELERHELERLQDRRNRDQAEIDRLNRRLELVRKQRAEHQEALIEAQGNIRRQQQAVEGAEARVASLPALPGPGHRDNGEQSLEELRGIQSELEAALKRQEREAARLEQLDVEWAELSALCREDLDVDIARIPMPVERVIPSEIDLRRLRLKAEQAADVEPGVVAECAAMQERHDNLQAQMADLEAASAILEQIMQEADRELDRRFRKTFERVDAIFGEHFRTMFGGGSAHLVTTGGEDVAGVDVVAQPPGKRARDLSALSGGERSLAASAFMFALIAVQPPPFCILDEVDAALDETNADRYVAVLRDLAGMTQFVVVTHNRGTMAAADSLVGVTLDADASSRLLSLRLSDIAS